MKRLLLSVGAAALLAGPVLNFVAAQPRQAATARSLDVMPRYDTNRDLVLPDDYRRWVLVGSALGLSYSDGGQDHQMFNTTLMEPSAYRHFIETGTFREGTMFALIGQGVGTNATPARQGQFATDVHMLELAVKDSFMPEKPAAAPMAIIARKADGTATAITGLRPAKRAAHRPTPTIASIWSRPVKGCRKPEASWPGWARAGPATTSRRPLSQIVRRMS